MMSRRVADNRLGSVKDDLLFALRRIQIDLDAYCVDPTEPAPLETMIDALEQVRGPLAALEHCEAVALLDEMRAVVLDRVSGTIQSLDPATLRHATDRLAGYLEACLSLGSRRPDAELVEAVEMLRRAHLRAAPTGSGVQTAPLPETASAIYTLQDTLKRIQQTIAGPLEQAADQPDSWEALRTDLLDLRRMVADHDWAPTTFVLDRLDRIVGVLAAGAAEYYGTLITGVCADILAGLGYCLEPLSSGDSAPATVLNAAQEHLSQLETLLHLPALAQTSTAMSTTPVRSVAPAAPKEIEFLPLDTPEALILEATPSHPDVNMSEDVAGLVELIGLTDADPEFIEVFLEEARGELAAIREQLALWRQHLENHEALATLRRSFHTLKGSGRMVGATVVGDFAWEFE
ncbi:MAG: Hpt domain-containing protein, partial [Candidatus Contendobacter sp.]|nr:Hpt domain-containing protein [Candidatus Contendobacter sp.]